MTEYGLFSDEGMVEGQFYTPEEARAAITDRYDADDGLEIEEICPDHPGQPRCGCEECDSEEQAEEFYNDLENEPDDEE
jgi:hypothetical protein